MSKLVINLTRFGDLIQTQPFISALAAQGQEVDLLCLQNFASAAELLRDVQNVFAFNGAELLSANKNNWQKALANLWAWQNTFRTSPDLEEVFNLTPSLSAKLLAKIIAGAKEVQGFSVDSFGFGNYSSPWAAYLQAASLNRGGSPFNLVDVIKRVVEKDDFFKPLSLAKLSSAVQDKAAKLLAEGNQAGADTFIGFQLGASQDNRRWPVDYFVHLGEYLWQELKICPVLVGSPDEMHLARKYINQSTSPCIDCIGQTDIVTLAGLLSQLQMLVTNDTGTMHLAAGLNIPILAIFLATAQPWDTGPYQEQSLCLEPDLACHPCGFAKSCKEQNRCRRSIKPEIVFDQVQSYLVHGFWLDLQAKGARLWESKPGEAGFIDLISRSGHEASDRALWIRLQRRIYCQFLDKDTLNLNELHRKNGLGFSLQFQQEIFASLQHIDSLLRLVQEQLRLVQKIPKQQFKDKLIQQLQRLQSLWDANSYLQVLGKLWQYQSQHAGQNIEQLFQLIEEYQTLVSVLLQGLAGQKRYEI